MVKVKHENSHYSISPDTKTRTKFVTLIGVQEKQFAIGKDFAASSINVAISLVVGGGVGGIQALIRNKEKVEEKRIFTKNIISKCLSWEVKIINEIY